MRFRGRMVWKRVAETHGEHLGGGNSMNKCIKARKKPVAGNRAVAQGSQAVACTGISWWDCENMDYRPHLVSHLVLEFLTSSLGTLVWLVRGPCFENLGCGGIRSSRYFLVASLYQGPSCRHSGSRCQRIENRNLKNKWSNSWLLTFKKTFLNPPQRSNKSQKP